MEKGSVWKTWNIYIGLSLKKEGCCKKRILEGILEKKK